MGALCGSRFCGCNFISSDGSLAFMRAGSTIDLSLISLGNLDKFAVFEDDGSAVPTNTATEVTFVAEHDPWGWLSGGDAIPDVPGWYQVIAASRWGSVGSTRVNHNVRLNGSVVNPGVANTPSAPSGSDATCTVQAIELDGVSDAVDMTVLHTIGSDTVPSKVQMLIRYLGPS